MAWGHGWAWALAAQHEQVGADLGEGRDWVSPSLCSRSGFQEVKKALEMLTLWENVNVNAGLSRSLKQTTI